MEPGHRKVRDAELISHWHHPFDGLETSVEDFYARVEASVAERGIPGLRLSRVGWQEAGMLSTTREYLRVEWRRHLFDLCAAPFGRGFFFSWWLCIQRRRLTVLHILGMFVSLAVFLVCLMTVLLVIPYVLGLFLLAAALRRGRMTLPQGAEEFLLGCTIVPPIMDAYFRGPTYYEIDVALMFQELVHGGVLEAVDAVVASKGLRALADDERKPVMRGFFDRGRK